MAELNAAGAWTAADTRAQYRAVARLRWQMFRNGFRRKGGKGELLAWVVLVPLLLLMAVTIAGFSGAIAWAAVGRGHYEWFAPLLWGLFILTQFMNIQLGQPGSTFDPTQLIRFPMGAVNYAVIRFFFGVMSPANVVLTFAAVAIVGGVAIANPALWLWALVAMAVFTKVNLIFTRMAFSWVDRWLATRRAREIFTALIFAFSLAFQYFNVTYNLSGHHRSHADAARAAAMIHLVHRVAAFLAFLPPGLTAKSITEAARAQAGAAAANIALTGAYGLVFFVVFAWRMRTEFRGEVVTESAAGKRAKAAPARAAAAPAAAAPAVSAPVLAAPQMATVVPAVLAKEWIYLRRNVGLLYGLIGPLFLVFLFVGKLASHTSGDWVFQAALAYGLVGVVPVSYNSLGFDGTGAQVYFMMPIRLRDVFLAKNLFNIALVVVEVAAVWGVLAATGHAPAPVTALNAMLWVAMTILLELAVGNYRSIIAPKKIDLSKGMQKQASPLSALLSMAILLATGLVCYGLQMLLTYFGVRWVLSVLLVAALAGAAWVYWWNLSRLDLYAFSRREALFEELGRKA